MATMSKPHIAILGAGPTGVEAALAAAEHGYPFTLYEAAPAVAGHMRDWGHVQLFTPWSMNVSPRMRRVLETAGHSVPDGDAECPAGAELAGQVLEPLMALPQFQDSMRLGTRVRRIGRRGLLKHEEIGTAERGSRPFRLLLEDTAGQHIEEADIVLDCTGSSEPNPVGDGGIPAPGEESLTPELIVHRIPNFDTEADAWEGRRVLLLGAGHSAQTALLGLLGLGSGTSVVWAIRSHGPAQPLDDDPLPERARLMAEAAKLAATPPDNLRVEAGATVELITVDPESPGITVQLRTAEGTSKTLEVDRILALTGRVGDHQLYRQLQVHECYATSGPMKLAAALLGSSGGGGDCLAQTSLGADTLKNPEPGFFILGSKSYGRRNDYLMRVGWEQVDEVFSLLAD